jgi:rhodanese-related sulfurtransferase
MTSAMIGFAILVVIACIGVAEWNRRRRKRLFFQSHSIEAEQLQTILVARDRREAVQVIDVRQPLDLLAYAETIPGARRIPPKEIIENPDLLPKDQDTVVYCTCPSDKTAIIIMRKAVALGLGRIKFLHGGLAAWKAKGYPVEPYTAVFHLDTPT